jgi:hypothetical protein
MFSPIILILLLLWVIGLVTSHTLGGFIHVLLGIVAAVLLVRFVQKRRSDRERAAVRGHRRELMLRLAGREK